MKALIIDDLHPVIQDKLLEHGISSVIDLNIDKTRLLKIIHEYHILLMRSKFNIDQTILEKADNLKCIGRAGAGMEKIDVAFAASKGIECFNSPEGNRIEVAEQAIGMLLNMMNKIRKSNEEVQDGIWDRNDNWGTTLSGKTVGIIGYGNMGSAFASRLKGFNVKILAHDKYKVDFSIDQVIESSLKQIQQEADIISLHLPLTEETYHYANDLFFSGLKKPVIIINTGRGRNLSLKSLRIALEKGKVKAACLDVLEFENENFEGTAKEHEKLMNDMIHHDNVLVTPHVAGWTDEAYFKHSEILADKIIKYLKK
jgi:D-3-phosphoglycerate dehydrogenase